MMIQAIEAAEASGVSLEQVRHVAHLAHLELTADELPKMARDLNAILGHIAQLSELDTSDIEPMSQVGEMLGMKSAIAGETLRIDQIRPSVDRSVVMHEAPENDGRFFKVPKVIER
jgi:aspartyl-tRNA(Asn)/glutamyl-tRNA(Gln) amidotransferase subunit C